MGACSQTKKGPRRGPLVSRPFTIVRATGEIIPESADLVDHPYRDTVYYSILADEWGRVRAHLRSLIENG